VQLLNDVIFDDLNGHSAFREVVPCLFALRLGFHKLCNSKYYNHVTNCSRCVQFFRRWAKSGPSNKMMLGQLLTTEVGQTGLHLILPVVSQRCTTAVRHRLTTLCQREIFPLVSKRYATKDMTLDISLVPTIRQHMAELSPTEVCYLGTCRC